MADGFSVHVTGDDAYRKKLAQLELFMEDLRSFWPSLTPLFIGWMGAQFSTEGEWGGQRWAALSPAYAVEKSRTHPGRSILIREGALRQAASEPRREATPRTLTLWIDDPVAVYHQEGTQGHTTHRSGRANIRLGGETGNEVRTASGVAFSESSHGGGMPARPLIPASLPQSALREIDLAAEEYVSTLVRRIGL